MIEIEKRIKDIEKKTVKRIIELIEFESGLSIGDYEDEFQEEWQPDEKLEEQNKSTCRQIIKNIKEKFGE